MPTRVVKRPEYDGMVADFEMGRFDVLVCWDLDRLTRQPRQLEDWIDATKDRKPTIVTANGEAGIRARDHGRARPLLRFSPLTRYWMRLARSTTLCSVSPSLADFDPEQGIDWRSWTAGRRRVALKGFIRRVEVRSYPEGMARTRRRLMNESKQDYLDDRRRSLKEATASRIRIVWQWEKQPRNLFKHPFGQRNGQEHRVTLSVRVSPVERNRRSRRRTTMHAEAVTGTSIIATVTLEHDGSIESDPFRHTSEIPRCPTRRGARYSG